MSWKTFWFETNSVWGSVDSPIKWREVRGHWNNGCHGMLPEDIYTCNSSYDGIAYPGRLPEFGSRGEHIGGKMTLGEFFDLHGMQKDF